jgi:retron-type reverse transcriptase
MRLTALWPLVVAIDRLREASSSLKHHAAPGVDGQTWAAYGEQLAATLRELSARLKRGAYQAPPVERVYLPNAEGGQRPIGTPTRDDKNVQRATGEVRNAVDAADFLGVSYGARPGRNPHQARDAVTVGIAKLHLNVGREAAMRGCFETIAPAWRVKCVAHRGRDRRVIRPIR